jgi:hypothetical protein
MSPPATVAIPQSGRHPILHFDQPNRVSVNFSAIGGVGTNSLGLIGALS